MRIMLFPSAYAPHIGGVEELTYRLADEYQRQGHIVTIVTSRWPRTLALHEIIKGIEVWRIDYIMPRRDWKGLFSFILLFPLRLLALIRLIRNFRPDIIHIQCVSVQGFYLLLLKKLLRFRLVVTLQGEQRMDDYQLYRRARLMKPVLKRLLNASDHVTACSHASLIDGVEGLWKPGKNSSVVWNGISLAEFDKLQPNIVPHPRPYIFATGRHVYNKGFDVLIEAFSKVSTYHPGLDLVIGGDGPKHLELKQQIENLKLSARIYLPGYLNREQTVSYFRNSLFVVLSSRYEGLPVVSLETGAAAKAIIATKVGGVSDFVQPGLNGLLVASEDPSVMAEAISHLLEQPELAEAMGQASRTRIEQYFGWPKIAGQYITIYRQITGQ